jgi:O-antigen biosynthesis protein
MASGLVTVATDELRFPLPKGFYIVSAKVLPRKNEVPVRLVHPDPSYQITLAPNLPPAFGWHKLALKYPADGIVDVVAQISFANGEELWQRLPAQERNHFALHLRCDHALDRISLIIGGSGHLLRPTEISFERVTLISGLLARLRRLRRVIKRDGTGVIRTIALTAVRLSQSGAHIIAPGSAAFGQETPYNTWIRIFDESPERDRARHVERMMTLTQQPLFSILVIVRTRNEHALDQLTCMLAEQVYQKWELIAAVFEDLVDVIAGKLSQTIQPQNVRVIAHHADTAATLNALTSLSSGDFVVPIPADLIVRSNALLEMALSVGVYPDAQLIYADEDRIEADGARQSPAFKPAWSPDVFDVFDYFGNITALRREAVLAIDGWKSDLAEARDHDLKLRIVDSIEPNKILHLAKILAHTPVTGPSDNMIVPNRKQVERVILDHCTRRNLSGDILWPEMDGRPRLKYRIAKTHPLVSLIIPTRDRANILAACVDSILKRTIYQPYEILIVDNGSSEAATIALFDRLSAATSIRIFHQPGPFNYSALNNAAAREAKGSVFGFLNNDLEVEDGEWLGEMAALACRPEVGCVGCKLLYPNKTIQHGGVFLGIGGLAGHGYRFAARDARGYMNRLRMLQNVSAVTSACLLIRRDTFNQVGGFDEKEFKVSLNDVDLCLRVRAAGYRNLWTPFAELIHYESITRGRDYRPYEVRRQISELNAFRRRWGLAIFNDPYYSPHLASDREDFSVREN